MYKIFKMFLFKFINLFPQKRVVSNTEVIEYFDAFDESIFVVASKTMNEARL